MTNDGNDITRTALTLAQLAGVVANVCDHAEHNERSNLDDVADSGRVLRELSVAHAQAAHREPVQLYADRLHAIEERNVVHSTAAFDGAGAAIRARSWRDLQLVQVEHDRVYHPDVLGLMKSEQLRHYALHIAKLAGAAAGVVNGRVDDEDFLVRRVPDMLLFGIKLSTVVGERLSHVDGPPAMGQLERQGARSLAV